MKPDDLDRQLQRLHEAAERISANLVELEVDSSRQLLEASSLEGESASRWSAASAELTELWRRQGLLEDLLQRADKLHGSRRANELRSMLEGPSIELASSDVPLAERSLLGGAERTERCAPDDLLRRMSSSFDDVKTVLADIGGAWDTLIPKLDGARRLVQESRGLADDLGEAARRDLESAAQTLDALGASVTTDPLSVPAADVDRLVRALQATRDDLEASAALKRGFESRILEGRALFEQLQTVVREGQAAHEELLVKISVPAAPPAPEECHDLDAELSEVTKLAQHGAWREARRALEDWTARAGELLDDARQALDANRAPIDARNQLRALLEAYRAKAKRLGVLEDPRLEDIAARAQEALYTAPSDLAVAAELVRSYQQGLGGAQPTPEATR